MAQAFRKIFGISNSQNEIKNDLKRILAKIEKCKDRNSATIHFNSSIFCFKKGKEKSERGKLSTWRFISSIDRKCQDLKFSDSRNFKQEMKNFLKIQQKILSYWAAINTKDSLKLIESIIKNIADKPSGVQTNYSPMEKLLNISMKLAEKLKEIEKTKIKPSELKLSDWFLSQSSKRLVADRANKCLEAEIDFLNLCINIVKYVHSKCPNITAEKIKENFPIMKDIANAMESKESSWLAIGRLFTFRDRRSELLSKETALKAAREILEEILKKCNKYTNDFEKIKRTIREKDI